MVGLRRARTVAVNKGFRRPDGQAEGRPGGQDAQISQDAAVAALTRAQEVFREQQAEIDRVAAARAVAQRKLESAWAPHPPLPPGRRGPAVAGRAVESAPIEQAAAAGTPRRPMLGPRLGPTAAVKGALRQALRWDLTLPAVPSAFLSGDPIRSSTRFYRSRRTATR